MYLMHVRITVRTLHRRWFKRGDNWSAQERFFSLLAC